MAMLRVLIKILTILLIAGVTPAGQQDQQTAEEDFKIKVDVDLVTTDVTVNGIAPPDLKAEDFKIYDNDIAQPISYFSRDQLPLAVAILIDRSGSLSGYLPVLQIAALSALRRLKPEDQVALFSFSKDLSKLSDLTEDRSVIAGKIGKLRIDSESFFTIIDNAIHKTARYLKRNAPRRRRAIILISDNCQSSQWPMKDSCLVELLESSTTLFNIRILSDWIRSLDYCLESDKAIKRFADQTGGEMLIVSEPMSLKAALEKLISSFRMQYTLGFNPSNPGAKGSFHRLAVKLAGQDRCPECQLVARSGYYSGVAAPLPAPSEIRNNKNRVHAQDDSLVEQSIIAAGTYIPELRDVPFSVSTAEQKDSQGRPQLKVDLRIGMDKSGFKKIGNQLACKMETAIFYVNRDGKPHGYEWRIIERLLSEEAYNQAIKEGVSFSTVIPLKDKNQILKIVVYDEGSEKMGSKFVRLQNNTFEK
jgi:Ca-activated chloride channel homolog